MAKKQRRKQQPQRIPASVSPRAATAAGEAERSAPVTRPVSTVSASTRTRQGVTWEEFSDRYKHVNGELRQIGILAGSFLVVLLVIAAILK